ncbi:MAG: HD-GYP domain-containing protein [Candidatus Eisenbacteria bacterium]
MKRAARRSPRPRRDPLVLEHLIVALGVASVSVVVLKLVENQLAFLNFFYLPVAFASWRLGHQPGAFTAVSCVAIVYLNALMNLSLFATHGDDSAMRWLDLGIWGAFLFLTAYAVGMLSEREHSRRHQLETAYRGILEIMAKFIDSIDRSTENHSRRVADRAVEVARELGTSEEQVDIIRVAAYLHDLGKVEVSTEVLHKAARLDPVEEHEMRRHVDHGVAMLQKVGGLLEHAVPIVLYHHEHWNGNGYKGMKGAQIPLGARIVAVADTYDAIVADRVYRHGRSHREALAILQSERGKQFDPAVVDAFVRLYDIDVEVDGSTEVAKAA